MNWFDVGGEEMVNMDTIVRAHSSEDGLNTILYTSNDSFQIPIQYQTFRAVAKFRRQEEIAPTEATNLTLKKILQGQGTPVP